jgi:hypothetical protein
MHAVSPKCPLILPPSKILQSFSHSQTSQDARPLSASPHVYTHTISSHPIPSLSPNIESSLYEQEVAMTQVLVQRACAKLRTAIGDEAVVRLNFTGDLRELLDELEVIQPVLEQVEMPLICRDVNRLQVKLLDVRHAAYRIMDMVDELQDATAPAAATVCAVARRLFS